MNPLGARPSWPQQSRLHISLLLRPRRLRAILGLLALAAFASSRSSGYASSAEWPMPGANLERTSWSADEVPGNLTPQWYRPLEPYISQNGWFYAVHAHGTPQAGKLAWKFQAGGSILFSAAFKDDVVFFAANDLRAYALDAATGRLIWKSAQLLGEGFHSWWPVVWGDYVVLAGTLPAYRIGSRPGIQSIPELHGYGFRLSWGIRTG